MIPAWPIAEHTGLLDITRFLDGELLSDLACPARCLKPVSEWPTHPPKGVVMASDGEWYKLAVVGIERGLFAVIDERDIMRDMDGALILNGGMEVKKLKEHADGTVTQLQRFITNLVPMNSYLRRLRGDSGLLPSVGRLRLIQLEADETLEIDSEDMVSAFNLFRMPVPWRGAFTYAKQVPASVRPGGDPNTMVYLAITTAPTGWVGAVDVIQHVAPWTTEVRPCGLFPDHGPYSLVCYGWDRHCVPGSPGRHAQRWDQCDTTPREGLGGAVPRGVRRDGPPAARGEKAGRSCEWPHFGGRCRR